MTRTSSDRAPRAAVVALTALTMMLSWAACRSARSDQGHDARKKTMTSSEVLDRVAEIAGRRPFSAEAVGGLTGYVLRKTADSTPAYTVYRSSEPSAGSPFTSVEVRSPTERTRGKGGMVILDLAAHPEGSPGCITQKDVGERFGESVSGPRPTPHMPQDSPRYRDHKQDWGTIRLGYAPSTSCLVKVVLDAT